MIAYMPSVWATKGNFEVIIADNGSTDGSVEWIEQNYPQTRIIRNGKNLGFAGANNRGTEHAKANILVFLNPDVTVEPEWLTELLKPFSDPSVGLTTSKLVLMSAPDKLNTCGNDVHISGLTLCRGMGRSKDQFPTQEDVAAVSGAAFAIRCDIFLRIGGFNEAFFIYMEETALSLESRLRGWRCVYVPTSIVFHDYALRFGPKKVLYQERNRYMMLLQIYKWPTIVLLLPSLALSEIVTWGFVIMRDRKNWTNKFKAYFAVFSNWAAIMDKRQINQREREICDHHLLGLTIHKIDFGQVSKSFAGEIASIVFDPLFYILRRVTLFLVRW